MECRDLHFKVTGRWSEKKIIENFKYKRLHKLEKCFTLFMFMLPGGDIMFCSGLFAWMKAIFNLNVVLT